LRCLIAAVNDDLLALGIFDSIERACWHDVRRCGGDDDQAEDDDIHMRNVQPSISGLPQSCQNWHGDRSEEHTSELQSRFDLVCRLLLEKKNESQMRCRWLAQSFSYSS